MTNLNQLEYIKVREYHQVPRGRRFAMILNNMMIER